MAQKGVVLGHMVLQRGIEVDRATIEVIANLPSPKCVKNIRSFLRHTSFYRRFIQDFSKIAKPLCELLAKETIYEFDDACVDAFETLKKALTSAPVLYLIRRTHLRLCVMRVTLRLELFWDKEKKASLM